MLSSWPFALEGAKEALWYHLPSAKWEWLARDSLYTAGNRKLLNSFPGRQGWKAHSGDKWECVGDQSDATLMYLTADGLSLMSFRFPWAPFVLDIFCLLLQVCCPWCPPFSLNLEADLCGPHQQASLAQSGVPAGNQREEGKWWWWITTLLLSPWGNFHLVTSVPQGHCSSQGDVF